MLMRASTFSWMGGVDASIAPYTPEMSTPKCRRLPSSPGVPLHRLTSISYRGSK